MEQTLQVFRTALLAMAAIMIGLTVQAAEISGAGATFPYPIYARWAEAYAAKTGLRMNYRWIGSGATFIFTHYLSKVSPEWKDKVGENTSVQFPTGIGGKGNEGVSAMASRTVGAIGYVEYAYAKQNKLTYALLRNKDGEFVSPASAAFRAAAANADWSKTQDFYLLLTNQPGKDSWPITGATFILLHKQQSKPEVAREVINFFDWAYQNGGKLADDLDYVPMPDNVVKLVEQSWQQIKGPDGKAVWTGRSS